MTKCLPYHFLHVLHSLQTAPKEKSISTKVTVATGGLPKAVVASPDNKMKVKTPAGPVISKQQKVQRSVQVNVLCELRCLICLVALAKGGHHVLYI